MNYCKFQMMFFILFLWIDEIEALAGSIIESVYSNQARLLASLNKGFQLQDINFRIIYNIM
ncbi:MAG: hypothetical protein ACTSRZ_17165 [Promethearchaeota archaeon]